MNGYCMISIHMKKAEKLSNKSPSKVKIACVIALKNKVISYGYNNMNKTHPMSKAYGNTLHAEISALSKAKSKKNLNKCTVYIYRQLKNGKEAMSRPCKYCMQQLKLAGIKKICYTSDTGIKIENI